MGWDPGWSHGTTSRDDDEFPLKGEATEKLKEKSKKVTVFWGSRFSAYSRKFMGSANKHLGYLEIPAKDDEDANKVFRRFLDKFGRRLLLDDIVDRAFDESYRRWEIGFYALSAGYRFFKENPEGFAKATKQAKNEKEFLMVAGID